MFCANLIPKHLGGCVEQIKAGGKHTQPVFNQRQFYLRQGGCVMAGEYLFLNPKNN